jgi:FKBP-type peptidyl-prolyl cis-trans isomerase
MNTRNIVIAGLVIIVAALGLFIYMNNGATPANQNTQENATSSTQVQAQEVSLGTGAEAKPGDTVSVLYVGQLQDGTVFDSSAAHNNEPLTFVLGAEGLIPGFQIGVNGMKEGGERLMAIPPSLGYGSEDVKDNAGKVIIPANSTIVFDVKLVKVQPATSTATQ